MPNAIFGSDLLYGNATVNNAILMLLVLVVKSSYLDKNACNTHDLFQQGSMPSMPAMHTPRLLPARQDPCRRTLYGCTCH